jgi:hypothetical protein
MSRLPLYWMAVNFDWIKHTKIKNKNDINTWERMKVPLIHLSSSHSMVSSKQTRDSAGQPHHAPFISSSSSRSQVRVIPDSGCSMRRGTSLGQHPRLRHGLTATAGGTRGSGQLLRSELGTDGTWATTVASAHSKVSLSWTARGRR